MTDGLKDAHREAIIAAIAANDRVERAVLFGSRATGTNTVSSDVDIALFGDRLTLTDQARLAAALDEIPMAQSVDLVLYELIENRTLLAHIGRAGIELYRRPTQSRDGRGKEVANADTEGWVATSFEDVIDFREGPGILARDFREEGVPLVRLAGLDREASVLRGCDYLSPKAVERRWAHFRLALGDVLLSTSAALGRIAVVGREGVGAIPYTGIIRMRPRDGRLYAPFIRYLLEGPAFQSQAEILGVGSVIRHFGPTHLRQMTIPVPPIPEQRTIAHILGALDDKIELNRRMNATLESMARALFRSWFVDFDPVRAKMAGRDTGLPKEIADLFPDRLVGSELGDAPEGWSVDSLAEHFDPVKGVSYKGSGLGGAGMPLHNLNSVHEGGGYKYEGIKFYAGDYADRHVVRPGDVIVANTEQGHDRLLIGYAAIVPRCFGDQGICSHHVYRLRPRRGGDLSPLFLHQLLNSRWMHDIVSRYANGTTVNMLPMDAVQKPMVLVPPRALLETFDALALDLEHRREQTVRESRSLGVVRDALLPKLVSGEMRVAGLEAPSGHPGLPAAVGTHGA